VGAEVARVVPVARAASELAARPPSQRWQVERQGFVWSLDLVC